MLRSASGDCECLVRVRVGAYYLCYGNNITTSQHNILFMCRWSTSHPSARSIFVVVGFYVKFVHAHALASPKPPEAARVRQT